MRQNKTKERQKTANFKMFHICSIMTILLSILTIQIIIAISYSSELRENALQLRALAELAIQRLVKVKLQ